MLSTGWCGVVRGSGWQGQRVALLALLLLALLAFFMLGGSRVEAQCLSKLGLGCGYASAAERERVRGV
eukprot:5128022-Prymnesium_polylepis.1